MPNYVVELTEEEVNTILYHLWVSKGEAENQAYASQKGLYTTPMIDDVDYEFPEELYGCLGTIVSKLVYELDARYEENNNA